MRTNGGYGTAGGSKGPSYMLVLAVCLATVLAALLSLSPWQSRWGIGGACSAGRCSMMCLSQMQQQHYTASVPKTNAALLTWPDT